MQRLNLLLLALLCSSSLVDVVVTANAGSSLPSSTLLPGYDGEAILQKDDTTTIALDDALLLDDSEKTIGGENYHLNFVIIKEHPCIE